MTPELSRSAEDYVKAIYSLTQSSGDAASTTALADRLRLSPGSISTMVKRLDSAGLLEHVPYKGVRLTERGERAALRIIRRHRLLELFLVETLGIPWEQVHSYAEDLEHAASDDLIEIIAAKLGNPTTDPHGDPIPDRDLVVEAMVTETLAELPPGASGLLTRVSDAHPEMLRYLADHAIALGSTVEMVSREPFDGSYEVRIDRTLHTIAPALARAMQVRATVT